MKLASRFVSCLIAVLCCVLIAGSVTVNAAVVSDGGSGSGGGSSSSDNKCGSTSTFFDWGCSGDDDNQIMNVLVTILNWLAIGVSVVVLIGIVYGAVMYASAGGNEAQTKKAIGIIRNAVIALVLYFAMYSILQYLIPGGVFSS